MLGHHLPAEVSAAHPAFFISSLSVLETGIVLSARKDPPATRELDLLLHRTKAHIVPLQAELAARARDAWGPFGKGPHPAAFNIGDCCFYALTVSPGEPLLCKGGDFHQTDLEVVLLEFFQSITAIVWKVHGNALTDGRLSELSALRKLGNWGMEFQQAVEMEHPGECFVHTRSHESIRIKHEVLTDRELGFSLVRISVAGD